MGICSVSSFQQKEDCFSFYHHYLRKEEFVFKKKRKRNLIGTDKVKVEGGEATNKPGTNEGVDDKQSRDRGMEEGPPESAIVSLRYLDQVDPAECKYIQAQHCC